MASQPQRRRLDWSQDPGNPRRPGGQAPPRTGLDYNRRLYAPESDEMTSVFGNPLGPDNPGLRGWQMPNAAAANGIVNRYSTPGSRGSMAFNPLPSPIAQPVQPARNDGYAYLPSRSLTIPDSTGAAWPTGATGPIGVTNGGMQGPPAPDSAMADAPPLGDDTKERWMKFGGSERTFRRAARANGIAPRIDARSRPAPGNRPMESSFLTPWAKDGRRSIEAPRYGGY